MKFGVGLSQLIKYYMWMNVQSSSNCGVPYNMCIVYLQELGNIPLSKIIFIHKSGAFYFAELAVICYFIKLNRIDRIKLAMSANVGDI